VPFVYRYYLGVLAQGTQPDGSIERQDFDKLRASLAGGNLAARLYAKWLTAFLDWIERFFGDVGVADRTLFPHAFGLETPVPTWTAPAFDRCLLLALIYPVVTIFLIWSISGAVGPAEAALGLESGLFGWTRGLITAASFGFASLIIWRGVRAPGWKSFALIYVIFAGAVVFTHAFVVAVTGGLGVPYIPSPGFDNAFKFEPTAISAAIIVAAVSFAVAFARAGVVATAGAIAFASVFGIASSDTNVFAFSFFISADNVVDNSNYLSFAVTIAFLAAFAVTIAFAATFAFAVAVVKNKAIAHQRQGIFLTLFLAVMFFACLAGAAFLSSGMPWIVSGSGALLLFLGLLTLLNAPFDWASLGLTRALLRRVSNLGDGGLICWRSRMLLSLRSSLHFSR
jgi:hypothetical protein